MNFLKNTFFRRSLVYFALVAVVFTACKTIQYVPVEKIKEVKVTDTTYLHKTDTLVQIPEVSLADFIDLSDTLHLKSQYAEASAWVDPVHSVLAGRLVQSGKLPVQIIERERVVVKDSIVYEDKPIPVEVEKIVKVVPLYAKILSGFGVLFLILAALWAGKKFL